MIYVSFREITTEYECTDRAEITDKLKKCGVALRDSLIKNCANLSNYEIAICETGKPYIKNVSNVCFNISHSGRLALCALMVSGTGSQCSVGADIEQISQNVRIDSIANRHFTSDELHDLNISDNKLHEFFITWTRKESYLKCTGVGLSGAGGLKSINTKSPPAPYRFKTFILNDSKNAPYMTTICCPADEEIRWFWETF